MLVNLVKNLDIFEKMLADCDIDPTPLSIWQICYYIFEKFGYVSIPDVRVTYESSDRHVREINFDVSEQDLVWLSLKHGVNFRL